MQDNITIYCSAPFKQTSAKYTHTFSSGADWHITEITAPTGTTSLTGLLSELSYVGAGFSKTKLAAPVVQPTPLQHSREFKALTVTRDNTPSVASYMLCTDIASYMFLS